MSTETEPLDELEVPHLKQRLWAELAELHAGAAPQRKARRSPRVAAMAAAAAVVLGVAVFATQTPDAEATVVEKVMAATDEALEESVVHTMYTSTLPDGSTRTSEWWHDETTGIARLVDLDQNGDPLSDVGPLNGPTMDTPTYSGQRYVDYCRQKYIDHIDTYGASTNVGAGATDVRDLLRDGTVVEDGTEVVDGRELIRLRGTSGDGGEFVLLADPDSYRVLAQRGDIPAYQGSPAETYTSTYEYLPRSAESLGLLVPPIPEGFTVLDPEGPFELCR